MLNTVRNRFATMGIPSFPSADLLVFWGGVQFGYNGFAHRPVDYARSLTCPVLFMHGVDDPRAKVAGARRVFDAVRGPKSFREFESVGHDGYAAKRPEEWRNAVAGFMEKVRTRCAPVVPPLPVTGKGTGGVVQADLGMGS